jgi:hypothetical protein
MDTTAPECEEVALWRAVIAQAFYDACSEVPASRKRWAFANRVISDAREWLLYGGKDFREVCALAMLDWEPIRERAIALEEADWPTIPRYHRIHDRISAEANIL